MNRTRLHEPIGLRAKKEAKIAKNHQFLTLDTHFPWGVAPGTFFVTKLEKKRKAREREWKDDDDDGEMMMRR